MVDGQQLANVTYDALQRMQQVAYPDGSALSAIGRDQAQRVLSQTWSIGGQAVSDAVVRSQSGRIVQQSTSSGTTSYSSMYGYDAAGRLTAATIPGHQLSYAFAATGGCGPNTSAGKSGNRTGLTDVWTAPGQTAVTTQTSYCYDWADRLRSTAVTGAIPGASNVADGVPATEIVYDARGNTTRLGDMQFSYDAANRHIGTTYADGSTVVIVRDATGRIVSRTIDPTGSAPAVVTKYLFASAGDAAWGQKVGTALTRSLGLPGGVSWTDQAGTVTWSFPNLGGHGLMTRSGGTNGALLLWDPFGQPVDPTTFAVGTAASNDTGQVAGNSLWHQGALKPAESVGSTLVVEMRARLYVPALGRFLQVDPIQGGVDNDYVWPPDPVGSHDLSGERRLPCSSDGGACGGVPSLMALRGNMPALSAPTQSYFGTRVSSSTRTARTSPGMQIMPFRRTAVLVAPRLQHIMNRHLSGAPGAGQFASGTSSAKIRDLITATVERGKISLNSGGRPNAVYDYRFDAPIGTNSDHKATPWLRVVVDEYGFVRTAFPF